MSRDTAAQRTRSRATPPRRSSNGSQRAHARRAQALDAGDVAWLLVVPWAIVTLLAIVVLGPPLGDALLSHPSVTFWPSTPALLIQPEPTEQARFLLAIAAAPLLAGLTIAGVRRAPQLTPDTARALVWLVQAGGIAFVVVCIVAQRHVAYDERYTGGESLSIHQQYFKNATFLVALAGAAALIAAVRSPAMRERFVTFTRDTRPRTAGALIAAVVMVVIFMLQAINSDTTIANAPYAVAYHVQFTGDDVWAVLDGRSPLVNYIPQYGALWAYPIAAAMALFGATITVFSTVMATITAVAMVAVYDLLRRVVRSAVIGLLLFLPFLATAFFIERGPVDNRYSYANFFGAYPLRFAGVWLLAWLTARQLDGARPRRLWPLFLAAGLVVLNNTDHGLPALGAVVAALLFAWGRPGRAGLRRLALSAVGGLAAAFALVAVLTLLREGSLPHVTLLFRYARLFAGAGFAMLPMPTLGLHLVVYATFVAALVVATVRAIKQEPDRLLTGMLAWVAVFGLGAGSYFAGRSHPEVLLASFSVWALALALLLVVALRALAAGAPRWPSPAEAACIFGFCVIAVSLAQTPTPWGQAERLGRTTTAYFDPPEGYDFIAQHVRRGDTVAILNLFGHRIAYKLGVADVTPYSGIESMPTSDQFDETIRALREAGGRKLFIAEQTMPPEVPGALKADGFTLAARSQGMDMWAARPR